MRVFVRILVALALTATALLVPGTAAHAAPAEVTGHVMGPDGPVAGALVVATENGAQVATTTSDTDGAFALSLEEGRYYAIDATAAGLAGSTRYAYVPNTQPQYIGWIQMVVPGRITGTVTVPAGEDSQVTVKAWTPFGPLAGSAVTGPDGTYAIEGLFGSQYVVQFDATDPDVIDEFYSDVYLPPVGGSSILTAVPLGGVANADLSLGGSISGTVTGPDGRPVGGIAVQASMPSNLYATMQAPVGSKAVTGVDGRYTLRGVPGRTTGTSPSPAEVRITATPAFGVPLRSAQIGPFSFEGVPAMVGADIQLGGVVYGTAQLYKDGQVFFSSGEGPGVCVSPAVQRTDTFSCTDGTMFQSFSPRPATQDYVVGPLVPGEYTARAGRVSGGYGPVATFSVEYGETFHCTLPDVADGPITPQCTVTSIATNDPDGVDDALEAGAPYGGDGNRDGIADGDQADVASLPLPDGTYLTLASVGTDLRDVTVVDAPEAPAGVQLETGLISFGLAGVPVGGSVDVHIIRSGVTSANSYWKHDADVGWYDASSLATFDPDGQITLHLTDGGFGDADGLANGEIRDPGAPAVEERDGPTVTCPTETPVLPWGEPGTVTANVSDSGSGVASPVVTVPVDTSVAGSHIASVTGADVVGNETTRSCPYLVQGYSFSGFRAPIDPLPTVNQAKAGSNVPVKWRLVSPGGVPVSDPASFVSATFRPRACASRTYDAVDSVTPSVGLSYDGDGAWSLGWKTSREWTGCGDLELRLADGSVHRAAFEFR